MDDALVMVGGRSFQIRAAADNFFPKRSFSWCANFCRSNTHKYMLESINFIDMLTETKKIANNMRLFTFNRLKSVSYTHLTLPTKRIV